MKIQIKLMTTEQAFYRCHVGVINIMYRLQLTQKQEIMLAEILYQNNKFRTMSEEDRNTMLFSTPTRKEIITKLKIDVGTFNNNITKFRKTKGLKGTILTGRTINPSYCTYTDEINTISIQLQIKKNDTTNSVK